MYDVDFIIKQNKFLAKQTISTRLVDYCSNMSIEMIFMNTESNKTNEPHTFTLDLSQY